MKGRHVICQEGKEGGEEDIELPWLHQDALP